MEIAFLLMAASIICLCCEQLKSQKSIDDLKQLVQELVERRDNK